LRRREPIQANSKVEVKGLEAKFYDKLMDLITLGKYPEFIKEAISDLNIKPRERILDFGAGTGRNALLMNRYLLGDGEIIGLEIGKEMKEQFIKNTADFPYIRLEDRRIDEPLPFKNEFDLVFISFVLHGFIQKKRDIIIQNALKALKPGGRLAILDYNNFNIDEAPFYIRFAIRYLECPLAEDFIKRDTKKMLKSNGFGDFIETYYFNKYVRLIQATPTTLD